MPAPSKRGNLQRWRAQATRYDDLAITYHAAVTHYVRPSPGDAYWETRPNSSVASTP